jgi:predicted transport protein
MYAGFYCAMALGQERDKDLAAAFGDLREMKVDVAYPFLLELYHDMRLGSLPVPDMVGLVRLIESYVFRRAVCGIPTNSLGKTFAGMVRGLRDNRSLDSVAAYLLSSPSYRRFPRDEEFRRELCSRDLYNFPRRSYLLRRLENHGRKEAVPVDEYTIEHIMPQSVSGSAEWQADLGPDWKRVHETWLHTLGNLTLTGYNSEYSNRPFAEKRSIAGGLAESPLRLNRGLGARTTWNEGTIAERAERLAAAAAQVWALPTVPEQALAAYQDRPAAPPSTASYALEDHPFVAFGQPMHPVFEALRKELLALDPCVTEDFLMLYISYKAESYFVNVIPQSRRLLLNLNLPFHELRDPEGRARDVSNVGHWGRGDVEVTLTSADDLFYVMSLIRQALERQLRTGESET